MDRIVIEVNRKKLHLVLHKSFSEWQNITDARDYLWDFPIVELFDGTIEINEDIWYWLIDGRCYETDEAVG